MSYDCKSQDPEIPQNARSVSYWVRQFKELGIDVSERRLTSLARKHKRFVQNSKLLLLLPGHIDQIFLQERKALLKSDGVSKPKSQGEDDA